MPISSLVLYAEPDSTQLKQSRLVDNLRAIGLISENCGHHRYLSGPQFFKHVAFLGCSPHLALTPEDGDDYLQIAVPDFPEPRLLASSHSRTPLCNHCKQKLDSWREMISQARHDTIQCPRCTTILSITDLNFRKRACYARTIIQISPVFESEAVPSQALIKTLRDRLSIKLKYAYI